MKGLKSMKSGSRQAKLLLALLLAPGMLFPSISSAQSVAVDPTESAMGRAEIEAVLPELRKGGYVFYIRHAATEHSKKDNVSVDLEDCASQRPLSMEGREQATNIGKAFVKLAIPVGDVLSSPFCRCKDTASLAFGRIEVDENLFFVMTLGRKEKQKKAAYLRSLITSKLANSSNRIIVSHTSNLKESVGIWPKPEGVVFIFRPDGNNHYTRIGHILPETWKEFIR